MNKEFNDYIDIIISSIGIRGRKARQIREDLYNSLLEKHQATGESNPYFLMGEPEEVALEFRENLDIKDQRRYPYIYGFGYGYNYEYISKTKLFGLPLIHVNMKPFGKAKGIVACGSMALGIISFGVISIGFISMGVLSLGILAALGGIALSSLMSAGGIAISLAASLGGVAIAGQIAAGGLSIARNIAFGGYANANIAIGGVTKGVVSVFEQHGTGQYMFSMPVNVDVVINTIKSVYPDLGQMWINIIRTLL